jgi:hypothetical protein
MSSKVRPMRIMGAPGPGREPLVIKAMTACDCGCGLPNRFEFRVGQYVITTSDPAAVDAIIEEMSAGRRLLWGEPKQAAEPTEPLPCPAGER